MGGEVAGGAAHRGPGDDLPALAGPVLHEARVVFDEIGLHLGKPSPAWGWFYGYTARGFLASWKVAYEA